MPRNVQLFERLAYGSLLLGAFILVLRSGDVAVVGGLPVLLQMYALAATVTAIPVYLIARRRKNWARTLFGAAFVFGLVRFFPDLLTMLERNPPAAVLSFAQFVMQATAMALVFSKEARVWFDHDSDTDAGARV